MCRWFAYLSASEECLLEDVLIEPKNSLTQQVDHHYLPKLVAHDPEHPEDSPDKNITLRNSLYNMDGMGMCFYTNAQENFMKGVSGYRPAMYKSISPPVNDFNFRNLCTNTSSKALFAHIRATSGAPVTPVNNHPFVFGRHTFMHNGVVSDFVKIKREMSLLIGPDEYANIIGSTDSEHLAALYMTYLSGSGGKDAWELQYPTAVMAEALTKAIVTTIELQQKVLGGRNKPNSLNLAATDGHQMICCRFRNHAKQQPPSLYYSTTAGVALNRKYPGHPNGKKHDNATKSSREHGRHVIVASEPTTYDEREWDLIGKNEMLRVEENGDLVLGMMKYDTAWNAMYS